LSSDKPRFETELADKESQQALKAPARKKRRARRSKVQAGDEAHGDRSPFFYNSEQGLLYYEVKIDRWVTTWVCGRLEVQYVFRNQEGRDWGLKILLTDRDGVERSVFLRYSEIQGQYWSKPLSDCGLKIDHKHARLLAAYLNLENDGAPRAVIVYQPGIYVGAFVREDRTFGSPAEPIIMELSGQDAVFSEAGTLAQWNQTVGRYCVGNSRLVLGVCAALSAPMLELLGMDGGGFNVFGPSSIGKTTVLVLSASVNGLPKKYMQPWRTTSNAIEGTAARFNLSLLCLDEIREANDREVGLIVMMLANGKGKGRMTDTAKLKESHTWKINWLSTGEHKTTHYIEQAGDKADAGMEIRQLDIPADPGKGFGVFENLHDVTSAKDFAEHLKAATAEQFGTLGVAWLERLMGDLSKIRKTLPEQVNKVAASFAPAGAESQVLRAMRRFALCAIAGESAVRYGLLDWPAGEATRAMAQCAQDWIKERGGVGNMEQQRYIERLRSFLMANATSRFVPWDRVADDHAPGKNEVAGIRKTKLKTTDNADDEHYASAVYEFFITADGWAEIFKGMHPKTAADVLAAAGMLERSTRGENYLNKNLPGWGKTRHYKPTAKLFSYQDDADDAC